MARGQNFPSSSQNVTKSLGKSTSPLVTTNQELYFTRSTLCQLQNLALRNPPLMLHRSVLRLAKRPMSTIAASSTPMEDAIRTKVLQITHRITFEVVTNPLSRSLKLYSLRLWRSTMIRIYTLITRPWPAISPEKHILGLFFGLSMGKLC